MKALLVLIVIGAAIYFFMNFGDGRVAGPMSPPVDVKYRDSYIGRGIVLDINTHSGKTLYGIRLHITGRGGQSTDVNVVNSLKPGEDTEVGWMELHGWTLEVGEEVSIYADGYLGPFVTSCSGHRN